MSLYPTGNLYNRQIIPHPRQVRSRIPVKQPFSVDGNQVRIPPRSVKLPFDISRVRGPAIFDPNNPNMQRGKGAYYYNPLLTEEQRARGAAGSFPRADFDVPNVPLSVPISQPFFNEHVRALPMPEYRFGMNNPKPNPHPAPGAIREKKPKERYEPVGKKTLKDVSNENDPDRYIKAAKLYNLMKKPGTLGEEAAAKRRYNAYLNQNKLKFKDVVKGMRHDKSRYVRYKKEPMEAQNEDVSMF